jgi:hypothetical protein
VKRGGLSLDAAAVQDVAQNPEIWEKVVRKVRARQMPPVGLPRPDEATYRATIASLEQSLDRAAAAHPNPGRTETLRRLTRTEYRNAVRDLLALDVDVAALLPADESSYGFDNVTVGDLSPTSLDRYVSAAEKISRVAVGRPSRSPGGDTIRIAPDLTQEEHLEGLPIGTRGGALVTYTFPLDGEYEIQVRLSRDRNEHVEGLTEAHEMELLLDRERVQVFTVKPPAREAGFSEDYQPSHDNIDQHLKIRVPVSAGPHSLGVTFLEEPVGAARNRTPAVPGTFQFLPAPADSAGHLLNFDHRSVCGEGPRRFAQPPPHFRVAAGQSQRRRTRGQADPHDADTTRLSAPGERCRHRRAAGAVSEGVGGRRLRGGHRDGALGGPGEPRVPVPRRTGSRRHRA